MIPSPVTAARPHRSALGAIVVASALVVAACSAKEKASEDSPVAESTPAVATEASQSTSAETPEAATTTGASASVTTTTSPVAASETTAPDVMRSPPIMTTVPDSAAETSVETSTTASTTPEPPATSEPAASSPATSVPAGDGCVSCAADFVFPYATFFEVPQLGTEPVRGTGCGADGQLGETIPDGIWDARRITISASTLSIDVQCVYYGDSGAQLLADCLAEEGPDGCEDTDPDFWFVNASSRIRTMPLAPSFRRRYATNDGCTDPGPGNARGEQGQDDFDSWVIIEQGMATFALTSCVYG